MLAKWRGGRYQPYVNHLQQHASILAGWQAPGLGPMPPERGRKSDLLLGEGMSNENRSLPIDTPLHYRSHQTHPPCTSLLSFLSRWLTSSEPLCSPTSWDSKTRPIKAEQSALIHQASQKHPEKSGHFHVGVHLEAPSGCFVRLFSNWGGVLRQ